MTMISSHAPISSSIIFSITLVNRNAICLDVFSILFQKLEKKEELCVYIILVAQEAGNIVLDRLCHELFEFLGHGSTLCNLL
jgi:hypothetical protein